MAKLTAAQAYAAQVKADRRAEALSNREENRAYRAQVRDLYAGTAETFTPDGRKRFDVLGRNNENKRGVETGTKQYRVTRLPGGLKASLASEKAARTLRTKRLAGKNA